MAETEAMIKTVSHMTLVDWLDDLTVRFLLNLPPTELSSVPRICFQVEEAQWFYEDFIRPANATLPSLNLRQFLLALFQHCPLLQGFDSSHHVAAYEEFLSYKTRVPVRGAIMMDSSMEKVLLVRGWKKGASWSFPRGKINKDEKDLDCAIREVYEETGFDLGAAGLVESNQQQDGQVKAIDVTMREQHMKLFVFRGVALDTYFEPKTRKEISKIQWYSVKDLPGFKKQKGAAGHGQGDALSTKFYMVAPFLGHLKKWINQQRKNDLAAAQIHHARSHSATENGFQTGATEEEGETEQEFATDNGLGFTARSGDDELKRLLSVGGSSSASKPVQQPQAQAAGLLAMLKGALPTAPHTPFERIDPTIPSIQPAPPHAYHPRHAATQHQQAGPLFDYSPQRVQQQNHQPPSLSSHNGGIFEPMPQPQPNTSHYPHLQHQPLRQTNGQQSFHGVTSGQAAELQLGYQANAVARSFNLYQQMQRPPNSQLDDEHGPQQQFGNTHTFSAPRAPLASPFHSLSAKPPELTAQTIQGSQRPLGSEQSMPEPSCLPPPTLNAQSLKLLNAFKSGAVSKPSASGAPIPSKNVQRAGSQQQAALLDLFKKPTSAQASPLPKTVETSIPPVSTSPALTDVTVRSSHPPKTAERRPTLNEITRTLPPRKPQSPISPKPPTLPVITDVPVHSSQPDQDYGIQPAVPKPNGSWPAQASVPGHLQDDQPKPRGQIYESGNSRNSMRASTQTQTDTRQPQTTTLAPLQASRSSKSPPKAQSKQSAAGNSQQVPQFSILQRPGSSASRNPRSPVQQSPLRNEAQKTSFQPQVLKRPTASVIDPTATGIENQPSISGNINDRPGKKDHLLALFGKAAASPSAPSSAESPALVAPEPTRDPQQKANLLGLLSSATPTKIETSEPPPAPQLVPERKPSNQGQQAHHTRPHGQQQLLLNLFNKTSSSTVSSPGTPISPFTLGTPISRDPPPLSVRAPVPAPAVSSESMYRTGSKATVVSPTGSGPQTPTETKDFLLGYLNGVVKKEGYRNGKKP